MFYNEHVFPPSLKNTQRIYTVRCTFQNPRTLLWAGLGHAFESSGGKWRGDRKRICSRPRLLPHGPGTVPHHLSPQRAPLGRCASLRAPHLASRQADAFMHRAGCDQEPSWEDRAGLPGFRAMHSPSAGPQGSTFLLLRARRDTGGQKWCPHNHRLHIMANQLRCLEKVTPLALSR